MSKKLSKQQKRRLFVVWSDNKTNQEKADILNAEFGLSYDESAYRKRFKSMQDGVELFGSQESAEKLAEIKLKAAIEKKKAAMARQVISKQVGALAHHDTIRETIREYIGAEFDVEVAPVGTTSMGGYGYESDEIYVVSDEHFRGTADAYMVAKVYSGIAEDIAKNAHKDVSLVMLGDTIEGLLHKSSVKYTQDGILHQMMQYNKLVLPLLQLIASKCRSLKILFVSESNHGQIRPLGSVRNEFPKDDIGYIQADMIEALFSMNPNVNVISGAEVFDHKDSIFAVHGHQPWAKDKKSVFSHLQESGLNPKLILMGHFHNFKLSHHNETTLICAPAVKSARYEYEETSGYHLNPAYLKITRGNDFTVKMIRI